MPVDNICLKPEELLVMEYYESKDKFSVLGIKGYFPSKNFQRVSEIYNINHEDLLESMLDLRLASINLITSTPYLQKLMERGDLHIFEFGPPLESRSKAVIFYKVLNQNLLQQWYNHLKEEGELDTPLVVD